MKHSQKDRVVVIAGASGGIGRAAAREYGRRHTRLALLARGGEGLDAAVEEARNFGSEAIGIQTDVSNPDEVERAAQRAESELGEIGTWINVAFTNVFSELWDVTPEEWRRVTDVTYLGYVWGTMAALRRMRPRNEGTIVQVGSALAYRSIPLQSAYCGAKSAIRGFTDSLRCELRHHRSRIRLTMVQMPAVNTPQFTWNRVKSGLRHPQPVPPIFQPEVAGRAIYWAAHKHPRELWVGSSTVLAIVAQKLLPGLADRYLAATGYRSQQTQEPIKANRPDNLFDPADGRLDFGAHGEFDDRAKTRSWETEFIMKREWLLGGIALAGAATATGAYLLRNGKEH
jgi:NAD(P)-dependent dehydrogenase (short-subunit alcohol dehydrogenase family)